MILIAELCVVIQNIVNLLSKTLFRCACRLRAKKLLQQGNFSAAAKLLFMLAFNTVIKFQTFETCANVVPSVVWEEKVVPKNFNANVIGSLASV